MTADDQDWTPPRGIRRPSRDELLRARRLRTLTAILDDEDSPFRNRLLDLADMHIETEADDRPRTFSVGSTGVNLRVDLPGSPPPRQGGRR